MLKAYIKEKSSIIEDTLLNAFNFGEENSKYFNELNSTEKEFIEILKYPLKAGGKRLRPILTLLSSELFGGSFKKALIPAVAIEMIHTYSLVHDDLPAMDNDDLRRGLPTTHKKYGEANAILTGDGLLTHTFQILSTADVEATTLKKLLFELSSSAGIYGMVMGQYLDLYYEKNKINFDMLKVLHTKKTGALIKCAVRMGAITANVSNVDLENITKYGEAIGLAFQIQDDILDLIGESDKLGKTIGKDEKSGKLTYVKEFGIDVSKQKAAECVENAKKSIACYKDSNIKSILIELADYIIERDK